ncbi:MAG: nitrate/nitrite transporter [Alphaproteobacteria bacterium]
MVRLPTVPDALLILAFCLAEVLGMLGSFTFAALLPTLADEWALTPSEAGWINGIYNGGYMLAVPVLVSLTDRLDPRRIYLVSTLIGGLALLAFALMAAGFWSALALRALSGVGLAGTYMPGLKALTDRVRGPLQARAVAFYTSSFGIGVSLSFFASGEVAARLDWQWAFGLAALGSLAALALAAWALAKRPPRLEPRPETRLFDFRPILKSPRVMALVAAYAAHNWELFGFRGWLVAFLVFGLALKAEEPFLSPTLVATVVTLLAVPASIVGGELAMRFGRRRVIVIAMGISAVLACGFGFGAGLSYPVVVALAMFYGLFVSADSAAITTGVVQAAPPGLRGAALAVHSFVGFAGSFAGPVAFGVVLELAGADRVLGWGLAFAALGAGCFMGPVALALEARARRS